jgi:hypothetical protein
MFVVIPVVLVCLLAWATAVAWRRTGASQRETKRAVLLSVIAACAWMASTGLIAASGILREWERIPPPFFLLVVAILTLSFAMTFSHFGTRIARAIPVWALVLAQAFRVPLELAMHGMSERGVMPVQMSYEGLNFDIVTGMTAIVVGLLAATERVGRGVIAAWNGLGLVLLINVVTVAILSTPRFRYFGDEHLNVWVTYPPFVWLPAVMVVAALVGHLLIFRALKLQVGRG